MLKKFFAAAFMFFAFSAIVFSEEEEKERQSVPEIIVDEQGHRFIEVRGAIPVFPTFTSHGMVQSFVVGFTDVFGDAFANGGDYDSTTPKFATDINLTVFPPITADYKVGFMLGAAIDTWNSTVKRNNKKSDETLSMNYYYIGAHFDYGHWVFSDIGTRMSIYGEFAFGTIHYSDDEDSKNSVCFDFCPFGIQFCPEKHIGIYFELPHLGARPFFQMGVSLGL